MKEHFIHISVSPRRRIRIAKFALFAVIAITLLGWVIMSLWNFVVPPIFGWRAITYFQGLGLFLLCRILFGSFRGRYPGGRQRSRWLLRRWAQMTPEERAKFRSMTPEEKAKFKEEMLSGYRSSSKPAENG